MYYLNTMITMFYLNFHTLISVFCSQAEGQSQEDWVYIEVVNTFFHRVENLLRAVLSVKIARLFVFLNKSSNFARGTLKIDKYERQVYTREYQ